MKYIVLVDVPNYQKLWDSFPSLDEALLYRQKMFEVYEFENPQISIIKFEEPK